MNVFKTALVAASLIAIGAATSFAQTTTTPPLTAPVVKPNTPLTTPSTSATTTPSATTKVTTPATTTTTAPTDGKKPKKAAAPRTAKSLACSAEADKQTLKGKPRKAFMKTCKKAV